MNAGSVHYLHCAGRYSIAKLPCCLNLLLARKAGAVGQTYSARLLRLETRQMANSSCLHENNPFFATERAAVWVRDSCKMHGGMQKADLCRDT